MTVLTADTITGNLRNDSASVPISGTLSATGNISENQISVTAKAEKHLEALTAEQVQTYHALNHMTANLQNNGRKAELRKLYIMDVESAKTALDQIGNTDATQMMSVAQTSTVANRVISDRLATAFSMQDFNVDLNVPVKRFADDDDENHLISR